MKKRYFLLPLLLFVALTTFSQTAISGKVIDAELNEELIGANVVMYQNGVLITGTTTDIDGNYKINVDPGTYDVEASYTGFPNKRVTNVLVNAGQTTTLDFTMEGGVILSDVVVTGYKVPLVEVDKTTSGGVVTSEQIRTFSSKPLFGNRKKRKSKRKSKKSKDQGSNISIKGSRSNTTDYYIDGIRVKGNENQSNTNTASSVNPNSRITKTDSELPSNEEYNQIVENKFLSSFDEPLSTFSIDVDNASYSNVRRYLNNYQMPPKDAVRIEEFINYFDYDYPQPNNDVPFSINTEISDCPWNVDHKLVHIGLQGCDLDVGQAPPSNLVFLLDVSGSMSSYNKLPLLKKAFKLLVEQLREEDRVSIVVYAGASGLVLPPTSGNDKNKIIEALDKLRSGGSTAGAAGIKLAYQTAQSSFMKYGNNRIILATDGDFNVGVSGNAELVKLVEEKRKSGVSISIMGFGMGNYKDGKMEEIADNGNGNYSYIDNMNEAKKVFVEGLSGTLHTIAKDVKLQIEFNPTYVKEYRLVGYENRKLENEDFANDAKDAGDLGAGHTVTALYEIVPANFSSSFSKKKEQLKYQERLVKKNASKTTEWMTAKLRYKKPKGKVSKLLETTVDDKGIVLKDASENFRFSAAVASFGMLLRDSKFKGKLNYDKVTKLAKGALGKDKNGYRKEFLELVEKAKEANLRMTAKK